MPKEVIKFEDFLLNVDRANLGFINETHEYMLQQGCTYKIEAAKSGHVLSYQMPKTKRVLINYIFRKVGMLVRIYGDNVGKYAESLNTLPDNMKAAIEKAPICKRLVDPTKCNSRCPLGYVFDLNEKTYQSCRYGAFEFEIKEENHDAIRGFVERELNERMA